MKLIFQEDLKKIKENSMKKIIVISLLLFSFNIVYAQNNQQNQNVIDTTAILKELREKEKNLNIREADLNAKEARLNAMEQDLLARETDIKKIRDEVTTQLKSLGEQQNKELDKLVKVYSTSKPKAAANIIVTMNIDTAISIFSRMTPNVAGKILNELGKIDPEYASKMAERLTYQPVFGDNKKK